MAGELRPRRSVLYMPGSNERAMEKARGLACDAIIFDMEDAVGPDEKSVARERIAAALAQGGYGKRERVVRINGLDTSWGADDLKAVVAMQPDAVLVPKVSRGSDLDRVTDAVGDLPIWAMIETPLSMLNLKEIAERRANGVKLEVFVMGTNDLAKETGARITADRMPMIGWLNMSVAAAKAYGIDILDGVYNDFRNLEGFAQECAQGRELGMDGKTLIHPTQIEDANAAFAPADAEVERARKILEAFALPENAGKGVIKIDGGMVELLHAEIAKRTVAIADGIAAMEADQ